MSPEEIRNQCEDDADRAPSDLTVWRDRGLIIAAQQARIAQLEAQVASALDAVEDAARKAYNASTRRAILGKEWEDLSDSEAGGWIVRALRKAMRDEALS